VDPGSLLIVLRHAASVLLNVPSGLVSSRPVLALILAFIAVSSGLKSLCDCN